jgi:hypothetical protein
MVISRDDGRYGKIIYIQIFNREPFYKGTDNFDQL